MPMFENLQKSAVAFREGAQNLPTDFSYEWERTAWKRGRADDERIWAMK